MINKALNEMATNLVGDCKKPNMFFVFLGGNVQMVTSDFTAAYDYWRSIKTNQADKESCLEDRRYGVICSREPKEDGSTVLVNRDDSTQAIKFLKLKLVRNSWR